MIDNTKKINLEKAKERVKNMSAQDSIVSQIFLDGAELAASKQDKKKNKPETVLKNFLAPKALVQDFEILCAAKGKSYTLTKILVAALESEVEKNKATIEHFKHALENNN